MKVIPIPFQDIPARTCARLLKSAGDYPSECYPTGFYPAGTLVISPSQRFKSALASSLMEEWGMADLRSPSILSSEELIELMTADFGFERANDTQRFSMFYEACASTESIGELFSEQFLKTFSSFRGVTQRVLQSFDELNAEEIDVPKVSLSFQPYRLFERHFEIYRNLYDRFLNVQKEKGVYLHSFLTRLLTGEHIARFFRGNASVLLLLPVSLTAFERRMYGQVEDRLSVVVQDTHDYDFSGILSFKGAQSRISERYPEVTFFNLPSTTHQLMLTLSIIQKELDRGVPPHEIAVLNTDSLFCNMLFDSLSAACIPVNYSLGLEVKKSSLYALLELAARFFENSLDSDTFLKILVHPLFSEAFRLNGYKLFREAKKRVCQERIFRLPSLESALLKGEPQIGAGFSLLNSMYRAPTFEALHESLRDLISRISEKKTYEFYAVRDILLSTSIELTDFETGVRERPFEIFLQIIRHKRYPLKGIYSSGVQVLGLLETRGIPFRSLIVPSFNEGYFPIKESEDILLNLQVRKSLGLPTLMDRELLQFYYLKRLVDSSSSAFFLSLTDKRGETDVTSRYSYYFSRPPYRQSIDGRSSSDQSDYLDRTAGRKAAEPVSSEFKMKKTLYESRSESEKKWLDLIYTLPLRTGSPPVSAGEVTQPAIGSPVTEYSRLDLDRIKRCETQYYIARVLGIREEEELSHEIELHVIGQKVHALFNELYSEQRFDTETLHVRFDGLFEKYLHERLFFTDEEVLMKKLLKSNLHRVIRRDLERFAEGYRICAEFTERELSAPLIRSGLSFTLKGRIDRIDRTPSGTFEIIDYKTGKLPIQKSHFREGGFDQIQLGFYGLLFSFNYPEMKIGALSYYDLSDKMDIETVVEEGHVQVYLEELARHLGEFLEAFNRKGRLDLTNDYKHCVYCPYYTICRVFEE